MTESTSGYNHPENESLPSRDYERQIALLSAKNERLAEALRAARDQIVELKKQLDDLAKPPGTYAVFLGAHPDGSVDISSAGRKMHVSASPSLDVTRLSPGQEVKLNEAMTVVGAGSTSAPASWSPSRRCWAATACWSSAVRTRSAWCASPAR
nr:hypothetical protein GCM10025730_54320 [Promicromonospora thailandica]